MLLAPVVSTVFASFLCRLWLLLRIENVPSADVATKHMSDMTSSFKTQTKKFVHDVQSDLQKRSKPILKQTADAGDEPRTYREESRDVQYGNESCGFGRAQRWRRCEAFSTFLCCVLVHLSWSFVGLFEGVIKLFFLVLCSECILVMTAFSLVVLLTILLSL